MSTQTASPNSFAGAAVMGLIVGGIFAAVMIGNAIHGGGQTSGAQQPPASKWSYGASNDELHGASQFAAILSDDENGFGGEMSGSHLNMTIQAQADGSHSIGLHTEAGNAGIFDCDGSPDITVKVDDGTPTTFSCHDSAGTSGGAFLDDPERLLGAIWNSKRVVIEPLFIGDGHKRFTFTTDGLLAQTNWR